MKLETLVCWLGLTFVGYPVWAQVAVEVELDQEFYLAHERCQADIRISNFSGRTLKFGAGSDWFDLAIESHDGYVVTKVAEIPPAEPLEIPSTKRGIRRVDLAPAFELSRVGRYQVVAIVKLPELNLEASSKPAFFHIMGGTKLWEQPFGVPATSPGQPFEVRRYALLQTNNRKRLSLYVRITDDPELHVFRVFPLGGLLSFGKPEAQVDGEGRLHVLFQTGAKQFAYYIIQHDGEVATRHMYQITSVRPQLRPAEGGAIKILGGFRVKSSFDIPPPEPEAFLTPDRTNTVTTNVTVTPAPLPTDAAASPSGP